MYSLKSEYYDLPIKYNETFIKLLVQSPTRMYAYWDVSDDTISKLQNENIDYNNFQPILKIFNITKNYSYELPVDPFSNNYYIETKEPDCCYKVCLIRKSNNKEIEIYNSNTIILPRNTPCTFADEVIFRNYICLGDFDRIKIYAPRTNHHYQPFEDVPFNEDNVSSSDVYTK